MQQRFQSGCIFPRGKRRKVWVGRWREPQIMKDGSIGIVQRSEILGVIGEISKAQAKKILAAKLSPLNSGMVKPASIMTFGDFAAEWETIVLCSYRPSTRQFYKATLERWVLPQWSKWRLVDIKPMDIRSWLSTFTSKYASSVIKHMRATLSKMLSDAVEIGHLDRNLAKGSRTPRGISVKRAVTLSPAQIAAVLAKLGEPLSTVVRLVAILGLRESELAGLRACDLNFSDRVITVRQSRYRGQVNETKNEGSTRVLPMPATVECPLRLLVGRCNNPAGLLFTGENGKPLNFDNISRDVFAPIADEAGMPHFTWRSFRWTSSTQMHRNGTPVKVAQGILGHSNPQITLGIYTETDLDDMRRAIDHLEKALFPTVPELQL
jgi:integrase